MNIEILINLLQNIKYLILIKFQIIIDKLSKKFYINKFNINSNKNK